MCPISLVSFAVFGVTDSVAVELAFARRGRAARDMTSLSVEFTCTTAEVLPQREVKWVGIFRMLRTEDGPFAVLTATRGQESKKYLLRGGDVFLIDPQVKTSTRIRPDDVTRFVENYFHPFVVLLDRARATEAYSVRVRKRDEYFTYLGLEPKKGKTVWPGGEIVLVHKANDDPPVGVPRVIRHSADPHTSVLWDIKKWVMNGDASPKLEEFEPPAEKDGWQMIEMPSLRK